MNKNKQYRFETLALHGGQEPDEATLSRAVPLYRTTSYVFRDTEHAADLFGLKELGNIYTRIMNPTQDVLEKRLALLEGGVGALALASGTSAVFSTIVNLASAGDEIAASKNLYGGTYTMFNNILPQLGIKVRFFDQADPEELKSLFSDRTKAVYLEIMGNPTLDVPDLKQIADTAHEAELPLIVDSTFATPYLVRPLEHGADIVVHSLTKWLGGHGTVIGGIVVDSGRFDWNREKFPLFSRPDDSYHGLTWGKDLGELAPLAFLLRMRTVPLRNLGPCLSPDNAWQFLQGIETLPLRMERHCENALKTAEFLKKHSRVSWVRYPGLPDDPSRKNADRYFSGGYGGVVVFGIKGSAEAGRTFIEKLDLFSHLANVGDAKSLAIHPASTTHSQLTEEQQKDSGISPALIRLSVGLENIQDILEDLDQALSL